MAESIESIIHDYQNKIKTLNTIKDDVQLIMQPLPTQEEIDKNRIKLGICYEDIVSILKEFLDIPEEYYKLLSIWIIGTYFHKDFLSYPFLFINAMRGSGKTRLLKLISHLAYKGDGAVQNNITESVLFRHEKNTILCIDEIEQIGSKEKQTLRELLNSAYKRGTKVKRMKKVFKDKKEEFIVDTFEPYFPIALANIWGLDEVLQDRAITLTIEKSNNPIITKKVEDFEENHKIKAIMHTMCSMCNVVCLQNIYKRWNDFITYTYTTLHTYNTYTTLTTSTHTIQEEIKDIEEEEFFRKIDKSGISGRNFELFFPLLITSKKICDDIFEDILKISKEMVSAKKEDEYAESKDVILYRFIAEHGKAKEFVSVKEMAGHFRLFAGDTDSKDEAWVNERWFGRALKRLCLIVNKRRLASGYFIQVDVEKAKKKLEIFQ